jgi:L,D-transpeptidase YcbB
VTETPAFSELIEHIVLNPYWNIPGSIAKEETIPKIKANRRYLQQKNLEVVKGDGDDAKIIDPDGIDWSRAPEVFPYRIRQKPGGANALGRIKFMLPNKDNIYLHDTPEKHLFDKDERAYSHGCIRVEKPVELAALLLKGKMTHEEIVAAIASGKMQTVPLAEHVRIQVTYITAWLKDGKVTFLDDLYERDNLELPQPAAAALPGPRDAGR